MKLTLKPFVIALALALAGPVQSVWAQPAPSLTAAEIEGRTIVDVNGKTLGVVEKALASANGTVRQVLVRTRKGTTTIVRTLPYGSLKPAGTTLMTVLSAQEFEAIPPTQTE